jgi:hypothetical protein
VQHLHPPFFGATQDMSSTLVIVQLLQIGELFGAAFLLWRNLFVPDTSNTCLHAKI